MSAILEQEFDTDENERTVLRYVAIVYGPAKTQGSKRPVTNKKTGERYFIEQTDVGNWRQEMIIEMRNDRPDEPFDEAMTFTMTVYIHRPRAHYKSNGVLKADAPKFPASNKGKDQDKIQRAVGDAAQIAGWVRNDSRICDWHAKRRYTEPGESERTVVSMHSLEEEWLIEHQLREESKSDIKNLLDIGN